MAAVELTVRLLKMSVSNRALVDEQAEVTDTTEIKTAVPQLEDNESTLIFSMNKMVSSGKRESTDDIILRLESFAKKYEQMTVDIHTASTLIEKSSQFAETQIRSAVFLHCRRSLHNIAHSMTNIDNRIIAIQQKLNGIRKQLPPKKHSLVENGPFSYKCVHVGGVRYREYPSSSAKVVSNDAVVTLNQVVEIAERVFISSEHSVFLHNKGVGWLFENKKDIICFVRVTAAPL